MNSTLNCERSTFKQEHSNCSAPLPSTCPRVIPTCPPGPPTCPTVPLTRPPKPPDVRVPRIRPSWLNLKTCNTPEFWV